MVVLTLEECGRQLLGKLRSQKDHRLRRPEKNVKKLLKRWIVDELKEHDRAWSVANADWSNAATDELRESCCHVNSEHAFFSLGGACVDNTQWIGSYWLSLIRRPLPRRGHPSLPRHGHPSLARRDQWSPLFDASWSPIFGALRYRTRLKRLIRR